MAPGSTVPTAPSMFEVGDRLVAIASFDNARRLAEVVHKQYQTGKGWIYYIHYVDHDKRLDEWITQDRVGRVQGPGDLVSPKVAAAAAEGMEKMTRRLKRRFEEVHHVPKGLEDLPPIDQDLEKEHHEKTKLKNVRSIEMGRFEMDTWYFSPFPSPYSECSKLHVCEFCLKYMRKRRTLLEHQAKCTAKSPPGKMIYSSPPSPSHPAYTSPQISMWEVDGADHKLYCQNLCLVSKLFLDHKTLYFDVEPFWFYVMCETDSTGTHRIVGYFSKEKNSPDDYNLACILTLPAYQRRGYGRFLIAFSYELSRLEQKPGTPERPLSDLGLVSYRSYWTRVLLEALRDYRASLSIKDLSTVTCIKQQDIVETLNGLQLIKYWKGQHILTATPKIVEEHLRTMQEQKLILVDQNRVTYTPKGLGFAPLKR